MKINLNDEVEIKLKPKGRKIISDKEKELTKKYEHDFTGYYPKENDKGISKWQLWVLMNLFGEHLHMGFDPPFEPNLNIK